MTRVLLSLLVVMFATSAYSDTRAPVVTGGDSDVVALCTNYAGTSVCSDATTSDEIVWNVKRYRSINIDFDSSGASAFVCVVKGGNSGYDAGGGGTTLHAGTLTETSPSVVITDPPAFVWVSCSTNTGGDVDAIGYGRVNR